jgi:hypothetical protein
MGQFSDIAPVKRCNDMSGVGPTQTLCNVSLMSAAWGKSDSLCSRDPVWVSSKVICMV